MSRRSAGFTMVELITIMIIVGILAAVAAPRLTGLSDYRALAFHDQVVSALRHSQKTATSHRRLVCVAFTASTVTLTIDHDKSGACDGQALNLPGASTNVAQSSDTTNAVFNPVPTAFNFQPDGSGTDAILKIAGQTDISVTGATGSVR